MSQRCLCLVRFSVKMLATVSGNIHTGIRFKIINLIGLLS